MLHHALLALPLAGCIVAPTPELHEAPAPDAAVPQEPLEEGPPEELDPESSSVEVIDLGDVVLDAEGHSARREFEVPADVDGVTVVAEGSGDLTMVVESLVDGAGVPLVGDAPPGVELTEADAFLLAWPGQFLGPNRVTWATGAATALVPNNPGVRVAPGTWSVRVAGCDELGWPRRGVVQLAALLQRETPQAPRLDLHLHLTGAGGLSAASAGGDLVLRRALGIARVLLRDGGLEVGSITYDDLPPSYQRVALPHQTAALFADALYADGVSVFLVDRLEDAQGGPVRGYSASVPGPAGTPSGVAVALAFVEDARVLGLTIAHEVGHYLGLFHTVELAGGYLDQLPDTAEGYDGVDNVMFPTPGPEARRFSPTQVAVMRRSASLAYVREGAPSQWGPARAP